MKIRTHFYYVICLILSIIPLSGCSNGLSEPQETVFNFLDQILSGDPQLVADAYHYVYRSKNKAASDAFGEQFKQRLANMKTRKGTYTPKTFLISENESKAQTATVSNQYLRIPDLYVLREIELRKVEDRWLIEEHSSLEILSDILVPEMKTEQQTPYAKKWHEAEIHVHSAFTDRWDQVLQNK